jgi:hypothetical protein
MNLLEGGGDVISFCVGWQLQLMLVLLMLWCSVQSPYLWHCYCFKYCQWCCCISWLRCRSLMYM